MSAQNTLTSVSPTTLEVVGELPITSETMIATMVKAAKQAQTLWAQTDLSHRQQLILQAYQKIEAQRDVFAELIHCEMGKPLKEAHGELAAVLGDIERLLEEIIEALSPEEITHGGVKSILYKDPMGVNAAITPWNFPLLMPHDLLIPSLMAGNAVLFKPSEETPMVGKRYADILNEYLPKNVLQLVVGAGDQGRQLVAEDVQLVTFVGSKATGANILQAAGKDLKRVVLELGGKDPMIVLNHADIQKAARFAAQNSFRNAGQVCVSTERIYVMDEIADEFLEELRKASESIELGAMIHAKQKAHVKNQIRQAVAGGAKIVYGDPESGEGNYLPPVIMTDVNHQMSIMRDETFGPVACVMKVSSEEEAINMANDTPYGLGAVVFGREQENTRNVARRLSAGMVGINKSCGGVAGTPWVGAGQSGYGYHSSKEGHRQFTQIRVLTGS